MGELYEFIPDFRHTNIINFFNIGLYLASPGICHTLSHNGTSQSGDIQRGRLVGHRLWDPQDHPIAPPASSVKGKSFKKKQIKKHKTIQSLRMNYTNMTKQKYTLHIYIYHMLRYNHVLFFSTQFNTSL